mgnify:CR=1 FL=1
MLLLLLSTTAALRLHVTPLRATAPRPPRSAVRMLLGNATQPASLEDLCNVEHLNKPSLEVIYDTV